MLKPIGLTEGHYECRSLDETLPIFTELLALEIVERKGDIAFNTYQHASLVLQAVLLATLLPVLRRYGYGPLPVHYLGKAATFNLLAGFPLLLLGEGDSVVSQVAHAFGWAFAIWGTSLYWWAGVLYVVQVRRLVVAARAEDELALGRSGP